MDQPEGEGKKLSIGEALEAMRAGRSQKGSSGASAAQQAAAQRPQRIPPGFWLQNLQDGIQRSRDQLYDSIAKDATAQSGMRRRDLAATEVFHVPAGMLDEVVAGGRATATANPRVTDVTRYQDIDVLDFSKREPQAVEAVAATTRVPAASTHAAAAASAAPLELGLSVASEVTVGGGDSKEATSRFQATETLSINLAHFEEVEQTPAQEGPKKFKVNPMIREIFQKKAAEAAE